ncbi:MAG: hypothetical protein KBB55_02740 [Candidatus Buchananbacteria bacterium]|nr:hypothetical protein [Candidatus Buchananbacteria bacterium]
MAKIVYGISGQGFGHGARSREIIRHLQRQGHTVLALTYHQGVPFVDGLTEYLEIPGLVLSYRNNRLVYSKTILLNLKQLAKQTAQWHPINEQVAAFAPDVVITDFEPISALIAHRQRLPLISIDNQHQLTNTKLNVPLKYQQHLMTDKLVTKAVVWGAKAYLIPTFFKTPTTKKDTYLFPPVIRQEVLDLPSAIGHTLIAYQGAHFDNVIRILKKLDQTCVIYGADKEYTDGKLTFKKAATSEWLQALASAKAVIGTAGSSLICEALHLKKPYLALPIQGQIEQVLNALELERLGYGMMSERLTLGQLQQFIDRLPEYRKHLESYESVQPNPLLAKLDQLIAGYA